MSFYSVTQIAGRENIPARRVQYWCQQLGFQKIGRAYLITSDNLDLLLSTIRSAKPGPKPVK